MKELRDIHLDQYTRQIRVDVDLPPMGVVDLAGAFVRACFRKERTNDHRPHRSSSRSA